MISPKECASRVLTIKSGTPLGDVYQELWPTTTYTRDCRILAKDYAEELDDTPVDAEWLDKFLLRDASDPTWWTNRENDSHSIQVEHGETSWLYVAGLPGNFMELNNPTRGDVLTALRLLEAKDAAVRAKLHPGG